MDVAQAVYIIYPIMTTGSRLKEGYFKSLTFSI